MVANWIIIDYYCTFLLFYLFCRMIRLNHTIDLLTGGSYVGNHTWNKKRSEIDNCFKVYQLTEGELHLYQNDRKFLLEKGKTYFINGNKLTAQGCENTFSTHWLHFIPKDLLLHQALLMLPLVVEIPAGTICSNEAIQNIDGLITNRFSSHTAYYRQAIHTQLFLQSLLVTLIGEHTRISSESALNTRRIEPAINYIKAHFTEPIRLEHLSEQCYMSPNYFHKLFTSTLHTTPGNYITLMRMNAALELLTENKCNSKEIAYRLGFSDDAYFSRVFKKHYGMTPGEYKKRRNEFLF